LRRYGTRLTEFICRYLPHKVTPATHSRVYVTVGLSLILGFLLYILATNYTRSWTGDQYNAGYLTNALITEPHPSSSLWDYVDFQGKSVGLTALMKSVVLVTGADDSEAIYEIHRIPLAVIVWILAAVLFYFWIGQMFFKGHDYRNPVKVVAIALVAMFMMPATAPYHLTHFFFSNALYGGVLKDPLIAYPRA